MLPAGWEMPLAQILPWVELFSGWFLVAGFFTYWASGVIVFQLVVFSIVLFASIILGTAPEDCGCLPGVSETPIQALVRDLVMLGWFALAFRAFPGSYSIDRWMTNS